MQALVFTPMGIFESQFPLVSPPPHARAPPTLAHLLCACQVSVTPFDALLDAPLGAGLTAWSTQSHAAAAKVGDNPLMDTPLRNTHTRRARTRTNKGNRALNRGPCSDVVLTERLVT